MKHLHGQAWRTRMDFWNHAESSPAFCLGWDGGRCQRKTTRTGQLFHIDEYRYLYMYMYACIQFHNLQWCCPGLPEPNVRAFYFIILHVYLLQQLIQPPHGMKEKMEPQSWLRYKHWALRAFHLHRPPDLLYICCKMCLHRSVRPCGQIQKSLLILPYIRKLWQVTLIHA